MPEPEQPSTEVEPAPAPGHGSRRRDKPAGAAGGPVRAGAGVRLAAAMIDAAFLLPIYQLLRWGTQEYLHKSGVWASVFAGNALVLAYTSFEFWRAATPGKALLRLSIRADDASAAPRGRLVARWALKYGGRLCGFADALTGVILVRRAAEWLGLAVFSAQPIHFVTLRHLGELLVLLGVVGFFFALAPSRLALYDRWTRTAVYRRPPGVGKRGFEPLMVLPVDAPEPQK